MRGRLTPRLLRHVAAAILLMCLPHPAIAADESAGAVRQVVLDIISFTRWPNPHAEHRLCIVGLPAHAAGFLAGGMQAGGVPVRPLQAAHTDERLGAACDVLYAGPLNAVERRAMMRRIEGYPILVVGEPAAGCIETTMFCLAVSGAHVTFASNLDAIARSGVKLNPRVLMLGRRGAAGAPP